MAEQTQLGLLGNLGNQISNLGIPGQLGLLSTGLSLLENRPLGESIRTGLGAFGGLQQINQQQKQREGIEALKKRFANNPKLLALIDANPTAALNAITTQAFAPPKQVTPFTALGKAKRDLERGLIEPEEFELIRLNIISPPSSPAKSFQKGGTFLMDDGSTKNLSFDPTTGGYFQLNNGKRTDVDISTATPISEGFFSKTIPQEEKFAENQEKIIQEQNALRKYTSYLKNIKESPQGVSRIGTELITIFKTLNFDKLSKPELQYKIAQGEVNALLGASRLETVGGGVMTEQDAERVLSVIGGNVNAFQNPQVVEAAVSKIFRDKLKALEIKRKRHNINVDKVYKNYDKFPPLDFDTSLLSDEVASELGFERRGLPENLDSLTLQQLNAIPTENLNIEELGKLRDAFQKFFPKKDD